MMMNCDTAFDHMTDAELWDSPELNEHLSGCPRCRQMQETLAPALGLFDVPSVPSIEDEPLDFSANEDVYHRDHDGASGSRPFLTGEAVRLAEEVAAQLKPQRDAHHTPARRSIRQAVNFIVGGLVACAFAFLFFKFDQRVQQKTTAHQSRQSASCWWQEPSAFSRQQEQPAIESMILGCLECHNCSTENEAASKVNKSHSTVLACVACHQGTISEQFSDHVLSDADSTGHRNKGALISCLWPNPNG